MKINPLFNLRSLKVSSLPAGERRWSEPDLVVCSSRIPSSSSRATVSLKVNIFKLVQVRFTLTLHLILQRRFMFVKGFIFTGHYDRRDLNIYSAIYFRKSVEQLTKLTSVGLLSLFFLFFY